MIKNWKKYACFFLCGMLLIGSLFMAPEQVQAFVLGICRRQQEEKRLNRQQRRQRAKGQDR